jgi:Fe-Mn family superoxide dismutase
MELHHSKHHQTYVTGLNNALNSYQAAQSSNDVPNQIQLQSLIKFHGGGHINHSLFWKNLAPPTSTDASPSSAPKLSEAIKATWGTEDGFKKKFNAALLGLQGSGWGWLVKFENENGRLGIVTTKDQDPIVGDGEIPILGVDMWEHGEYVEFYEPTNISAYYLQYLNGKAAYVENIWTVINWKTAEERFNGHRDAFSILKASV